MSEESPEKLVFSVKPDFKWAAAYQAYEKAFNASDPTVKAELNDAIKKLYDNQIDYGTFYSIVNPHIEGAEKGSSYRRARIEGSRKQEYAKSEAKKGRNERYRG